MADQEAAAPRGADPSVASLRGVESVPGVEGISGVVSVRGVEEVPVVVSASQGAQVISAQSGTGPVMNGSPVILDLCMPLMMTLCRLAREPLSLNCTIERQQLLPR